MLFFTPRILNSFSARCSFFEASSWFLALPVQC
jgi:hypothetical protein